MGIMDRFTKKTDEKAPKAAKAPRASAKGGKAPAKKSAETESTVQVDAKNVASTVIVKPLVTEKSAHMESYNQYAFVVARDANKIQVKQAIKARYGVDAVNVRVMNIDGKRVRFGSRAGRRSDYKKAIVTVPAGKSLKVHEGV